MVHVQKADSATFSAYKTYAWVHSSETNSDSTQKATFYADIPIKNAVNTELAKLGWTKDSKTPDVLVSYDVLVKESSKTVSNPVYFQPYRRYYYNPYYYRWGSIYYPSQFAGYEYYSVPVQEGVLIISMMDADTDKVIWQGWTKERMEGSAALSESEIAINAKNIMDELAVAP